MKPAILILFATAAAAGYAAAPTVTLDGVRQRWPWERKVDVDFTVAADAGITADVRMRCFDRDAELEIPRQAMSGETEWLSAGKHRVTIDPMLTKYAGKVLDGFRVELEIAETPLYLVVDLTKAPGEAGQIERVTKSALLAGEWGSYAVNPVPGVESVIWTGVTNDAVYATDKMVFRNVRPGSFTMGVELTGNAGTWYERTAEVTLSRGYWVGVFEVTQAQWTRLMESNPSKFTKDGDMRPVETVAFANVRGWENNWPADGYGTAKNGTFLQKLSAKAGMVADLPTYAQWQYACMAGSRTYFNDGSAKPKADVIQKNDAAARVARYVHNSDNSVCPDGKMPEWNDDASLFADIGTEAGTARVGRYRPNAWGLYDMHGNVWEMLLDVYRADWDYGSEGPDPQGPSGAPLSARVRCGGNWSRDARYLRTGYLGYDYRTNQLSQPGNYEIGLRAVLMPSVPGE